MSRERHLLKWGTRRLQHHQRLERRRAVQLRSQDAALQRFGEAVFDGRRIRTNIEQTMKDVIIHMVITEGWADHHEIQTRPRP